jgi:hypothetical protein
MNIAGSSEHRGVSFETVDSALVLPATPHFSPPGTNLLSTISPQLLSHSDANSGSQIAARIAFAKTFSVKDVPLPSQGAHLKQTHIVVPTLITCTAHHPLRTTIPTHYLDAIDQEASISIHQPPSAMPHSISAPPTHAQPI